jgi:hypothetical protein
MPAPSFPFTTVASVDRWFNFHHTVANRRIPLYLTPDALGTTSGEGQPSGAMRQAQALNAILQYCFDHEERVTILGSKWSMSNVLDPGRVIIDPGAFNKIAKVNPAWLTKRYTDGAKSRNGVPIIVQGGTHIGYLNQKLGESGLALPTSGASDGHRIAGCIATGSHGSAIGVGAVHDAVLGVLLVTAPNEAVFLQPKHRRFTSDLATWFASQTTFEVEDLPDDDLFSAAQVALGSLGFVHSVVIEAVPLYQLSGKMLARPLFDPDVWTAMETLHTKKLDPRPDPHHFSVVLSPYAKAPRPGAFVEMLWKCKPTCPFTPAQPPKTMVPADTSRLLSALLNAVSGAGTAPILELALAAITADQYTIGDVAPLFPGQAFGPTDLMPGNGRSTELVFAHEHTGKALRAILDALHVEAQAGRHLLGAIGVRFVPRTGALLGTNVHDMNTYAELVSLGSANARAVQEACWGALRAANVPFTCHWGMEYGMDSKSVRAYFTPERVDRWKVARRRLLPTKKARKVFATPILGAVGLR